jgi:hypothetical protein
VKPLARNGLNPARTILLDDSLHKILPHEQANIIVLPSFRDGYELGSTKARKAQQLLPGTMADKQRGGPFMTNAPGSPASHSMPGAKEKRGDVKAQHFVGGFVGERAQGTAAVRNGNGGTFAAHKVHLGDKPEGEGTNGLVGHGPGWGPGRHNGMHAIYKAHRPPIKRIKPPQAAMVVQRNPTETASIWAPERIHPEQLSPKLLVSSGGCTRHIQRHHDRLPEAIQGEGASFAEGSQEHQKRLRAGIVMIDSDSVADLEGCSRRLPLLRLVCVLLLKERLELAAGEDVRSHMLPRIRDALNKVCVRFLYM